MGVASAADKVSLAGKSQSRFFFEASSCMDPKQGLFGSRNSSAAPRQRWLLALQHFSQAPPQRSPMVAAISAVEQPLLTWIGLFVSVASPHFQGFLIDSSSSLLRLYSVTD